MDLYLSLSAVSDVTAQDIEGFVFVCACLWGKNMPGKQLPLKGMGIINNSLGIIDHLDSGVQEKKLMNLNWFLPNRVDLIGQARVFTFTLHCSTEWVHVQW